LAEAEDLEDLRGPETCRELLPAAVLTNRLIVMPFLLLRFPLPMKPSNMQDDILSHLCKLGIMLVPNETPEIA
jgi:hypothetical protein